MNEPNEPLLDTLDMAKTKSPAFAAFDKALDSNPLFGTDGTATVIREVELAKIVTNPNQPRKRFADDSIQELADSVEQHGLINPITLKDNGDGSFVLIAGERRYRAHQRLGRQTILATLNEGDSDVLAIIENVQREDLDPIEEAEAYVRLMKLHDYSQSQIAELVGKSRNRVNEVVSLAGLPESVIAVARASSTPLSTGVLVEIAKHSSEEEQLALIQEALDTDLGVRELRERRKSARSSPAPSGAVKSASVKAAGARKNRLIRSLASTVKAFKEAGRPDDFPGGSDALEKLVDLRNQLNEAIDQITEHGRITR